MAGLLFSSVHAAQGVTQTDTLALQRIEIMRSEMHNLQALVKSLESTEPVSAGAYIVMEVESQKIILENDTTGQHSIASVTKLMNAVVALENASPKTTVRLTRGMLKPEGQSPSLFANLKISVGDLIKASLTQSVNDAAEALSYAVGVGRFVKLMNGKAKALGMENTAYYDAHGLNPKNISTAKDLAKLATYIYRKHPEILATTKNNNFWLPNARGKLLKFKNLNNFYALPDFIGGKTGYLPKAKETMVSLFDVNGKATVVVVLYSDNAQRDTLKLIELAKT